MASAFRFRFIEADGLIDDIGRHLLGVAVSHLVVVLGDGFDEVMIDGLDLYGGDDPPSLSGPRRPSWLAFSPPQILLGVVVRGTLPHRVHGSLKIELWIHRLSVACIGVYTHWRIRNVFSVARWRRVRGGSVATMRVESINRGEDGEQNADTV